MAKSINISIKGLDIPDKLIKIVEEKANGGLEDVALDLIRVSSSITPYKTGKLSQSYKNKKTKSNGLDSYSITYTARAKDGFNYARWTHNANYNLGEGSKRRVPSKSKYSVKTFKVGKGYLENTAQTLEKNYATHVGNKVKTALKRKVK